MKLFFNIVTSFALAYWPILVMTSVMIFDSPGSTDNRRAILMALTVVFMPMILGVLYFIFDQTFWGVKPRTFLLITIIVPVLAALLFGYPKLLLNSVKGISSNGYFVKEDKVYYEGKLIEAKPTGFETLDEFKTYARDAEGVYFRGRRIEGADASTFSEIKKEDLGTSYFKDKNFVYRLGKKIEGLKPVSVKVLNEMYLVDNDSVFYFQNKIAGADPGSFRVFADQESWGKDKNTVYFQNVAYPEVDPATLEFLERGYAKDKSKVYYREGNVLNIVAAANAATFKVTNWDQKTESEATDGTKYFLQGKAK